MGKQAPPLAAEIEALKEAYAAYNRNDIPAMVSTFDPQIEWIDPEDYPGGGTHRGYAAVTNILSQGRAGWDGGCEPERFVVSGDKVVVFVHLHVRPKDSAEWIDARLADVYTFHHGKAIQRRHFPDRQQALEWAGAQAPNPH